MIKLFCIFLSFFIFASQAFAYKVYSYDENGNRVYKTIERKDYYKNKHRPKRSYVRTPRYNKDVTDVMRSRKRTFAQATHRK